MASLEQPNMHLKWGNHYDVLVTKFFSLLEQDKFVDVTLMADGGKIIKAHRLILSASSQYLEVNKILTFLQIITLLITLYLIQNLLLNQQPGTLPFVIKLRNIKFEDLQLLVEVSKI